MTETSCWEMSCVFLVLFTMMGKSTLWFCYFQGVFLFLPPLPLLAQRRIKWKDCLNYTRIFFRHPSPEPRGSGCAPLPLEVCLLPPPSYSPWKTKNMDCSRDHFPFSLKLLLIFSTPELLTRSQSCLKWFCKVKEANLFPTVYQMVAHLSTGIVLAKQKQ